MRNGRSRGWRSGAVDRVWLHELDARAVGVVDIQLTLAIDAGLNLQRAVVANLRGALGENGFGRLDIRDFQAKVMILPAFVGIRRLGVQHQLDELAAARQL